MILLIDNYDSFVHNLARYLRRLGQQTQVVRNDAITVAEVRSARPSALVLSPGPCTPLEAGCSLTLVRELWREVPILGVCLGHQTIAAAFGGKIVQAPEPMHGRTSRVWHQAKGIFQDIPNPVTVCRYHSLIAEAATLSPDLAAMAHTDDGLIMALQHRQAPVIGLQFHPEAILTEHGYQMLANFLKVAGIPVAHRVPSQADELIETHAFVDSVPKEPVTF